MERSFFDLSWQDETPQDLERKFWREFLADVPELARQTSIDQLIGMTDEFIVPIPGVSELVREIHARNVPQGICSNNNAFWFPRQIAKCGLEGIFTPDQTILSFHFGHSKHAERDGEFPMFAAAVHTLGVSKEECFFVDDRESNVNAFHRYGGQAVLFTDATQLRAELANRSFL